MLCGAEHASGLRCEADASADCRETGHVTAIPTEWWCLSDSCLKQLRWFLPHGALWYCLDGGLFVFRMPPNTRLLAFHNGAELLTACWVEGQFRPEGDNERPATIGPASLQASG